MQHDQQFLAFAKGEYRHQNASALGENLSDSGGEAVLLLGAVRVVSG